jgi:Zn-finger nucleic acid-binding protein
LALATAAIEENHMECPNCLYCALVLADREGVEIDYCTLCRGVWLDRGELDKLIERAVTAATAENLSTSRRSQPDFADADYQSGRIHRGGRRRSRLTDIFD